MTIKKYRQVAIKPVSKRGAGYNKTRCAFSIISSVVRPEQMTRVLGKQPDRTFEKGPYRITESGTVYTHPHHLWEINCKAMIHEEPSISPYIHYLKKRLKHQLEILYRYKQDPQYHLIISIWIETELSPTGFSLCNKELDFIHSICNRFDCRLVANEDVTVRPHAPHTATRK